MTKAQLAERLNLPESAVSAFEDDCRLEFFEGKAVIEALGMDLESFGCRWDSTCEDLDGSEP